MPELFDETTTRRMRKIIPCVILVLLGVMLICLQQWGPAPEEETPLAELPQTVSDDIPPLAELPVLEEEPPLSQIDRKGTVVRIDKAKHKLELFENGRLVKEYRVAVGKNTGDKQRVGDMRTPEGEFPVQQIQDASGWSHDFRDGKGVIKGAYGPLFIRLKTPGWKGIGIHGTHDPNSIGTNVTEGCIRMHNEELREFVRKIDIGTTVIIAPN